ncbi:hypothetical protein ES706_06605 [subsurface metagenome]
MVFYLPLVREVRGAAPLSFKEEGDKGGEVDKHSYQERC